ncbi:MAG: prepilin-type N-terminal cleavage/methylation domain-containing protein [Cyanobacteria bacterium P01_D01_bin.105]
MRSTTLLLYKCLLTLKRFPRSKGFTLLELLISIVVASLVISGLLYVVVELVTLDNQESRLDQVQLDTKRAMDYITNDLQEAVYVYEDPSRIATELASDSNFPNGTGNIPVLSFWRIDPIEDNIPACVAGSSTAAACEVLSIRQAAYTLVVYIQTENNGNSNWPGQSRIIRYELSKYSDLSTFTVRSGYRDPTDPTDENAPFEVWTADGTPSGTSAVLVDFIAAPDIELNRAPLSDAGAACSSYGSDAGVNFYNVSPSTATTTANTSFFACVRSSDPDNDPSTTNRENQDVYVFLRGSAQAASSFQRYAYSEESSLPMLETQVLVKGIIDKNLN